MEFNPVGVFSLICALIVTLMTVLTSQDDVKRVGPLGAFLCFVFTFGGFWLLLSWVFPNAS